MGKFQRIVYKLFKNSNFSLQEIAFMREQDGVPEKEFKSKCCDLFQITEEVLRAYLVRVQYDSKTNTGQTGDVALCIKKISGNDEELVKKIGELFAMQFGETEHLDIMFINDRNETTLKSICRPFYARYLQCSH